ncbi:MAG: hypothetical protein IJF87_11260 [Erysipelotrichaceae bacterium]|nr:hypothetical protein [Erysipelotrichaceae bacterium]
MSAYKELFDILSASEMSESEICKLLGRFLEEEADMYVECMELIRDHLRFKR